MDAPIEVMPYDGRWPETFEAERRALAVVLGPWLQGPIEHVGSTAVPGLAAKPVIDIMAGVATLDGSRPALARLEAELAYCYAPYRADVMHWLCKPSPARRTHHLHLVVWQSPLWVARIAFRDALRADAALADSYAALKRQLSERFRSDREAYTEAKSEFIERVLASTGSPPGANV